MNKARLLNRVIEPGNRGDGGGCVVCGGEVVAKVGRGGGGLWGCCLEVFPHDGLLLNFPLCLCLSSCSSAHLAVVPSRGQGWWLPGGRVGSFQEAEFGGFQEAELEVSRRPGWRLLGGRVRRFQEAKVRAYRRSSWRLPGGPVGGFQEAELEASRRPR